MANKEIELEVIDEDELSPTHAEKYDQPNEPLIAAYQQTLKFHAEWIAPTAITIKKV